MTTPFALADDFYPKPRRLLTDLLQAGHVFRALTFLRRTLEKSCKLTHNCWSPFCRHKETKMVCCDSCRDFEVCEAKTDKKACCSYCDEFDVCCALEDQIERFIWS